MSYQSEDPEYTSSVIWAMAEARGKVPRGAKDHYHPIERAAITRGEEAVRNRVESADQAEAELRAAEAEYFSLNGR